MSNPTKATCNAVDTRDKHSCVKCGVSLHSTAGSRHHRKLRSQGGKHDVENLILLCGSGTTGCHGWVHANPKEAYAGGFIVRSSKLPVSVPVLYADGWHYLEGVERYPVNANTAVEYMVLLGAITTGKGWVEEWHR